MKKFLKVSLMLGIASSITFSFSNQSFAKSLDSKENLSISNEDKVKYEKLLKKNKSKYFTVLKDKETIKLSEKNHRYLVFMFTKPASDKSTYDSRQYTSYTIVNGKFNIPMTSSDYFKLSNVYNTDNLKLSVKKGKIYKGSKPYTGKVHLETNKKYQLIKSNDFVKNTLTVKNGLIKEIDRKYYAGYVQEADYVKGALLIEKYYTLAVFNPIYLSNLKKDVKVEHQLIQTKSNFKFKDYNTNENYSLKSKKIYKNNVKYTGEVNLQPRLDKNPYIELQKISVENGLTTAITYTKYKKLPYKTAIRNN